MPSAANIWGTLLWIFTLVFLVFLYAGWARFIARHRIRSKPIIAAGVSLIVGAAAFAMTFTDARLLMWSLARRLAFSGAAIAVGFVAVYTIWYLRGQTKHIYDEFVSISKRENLEGINDEADRNK